MHIYNAVFPHQHATLQGRRSLFHHNKSGTAVGDDVIIFGRNKQFPLCIHKPFAVIDKTMESEFVFIFLILVVTHYS